MAERRTVFRPPYGFGCADGPTLTDESGTVHETKVLLFQDPAGDVVEIVLLSGDVDTLISRLRGVEVAPASALQVLQNGRRGG